MTDNIAVTISMAAAIVSFISVFFVWRQTNIQKNTIRAQLSTDLIMKVHYDVDLQKVLYLIFEDSIEFQRTSTGKFAIIMKGTDADICPEIDKVLNVFQIVGNLLSTKALEKSDLRNLEYEIVSLGRNPVIYNYLEYLNSEYQIMSGIRHDHFRYFKRLYLCFEYDAQYANKIKKCLM